MCDYSLEMYGSRPAREGEIYVTTRFPSGSIGFASAGDPRTAVCMQCDTKVMPRPISTKPAIVFAEPRVIEHRARRNCLDPRPMFARLAAGLLFRSVRATLLH